MSVEEFCAWGVFPGRFDLHPRGLLPKEKDPTVWCIEGFLIGMGWWRGVVAGRSSVSGGFIPPGMPGSVMSDSRLGAIGSGGFGVPA